MDDNRYWTERGMDWVLELKAAPKDKYIEIADKETGRVVAKFNKDYYQCVSKSAPINLILLYTPGRKEHVFAFSIDKYHVLGEPLTN